MAALISEVNQAPVWIIAAQPAVRRTLAHALGAAARQARYSAHAPAALQLALQSSTTLSLLLVAVDAGPELALRACQWLREQPALAAVPMLVVLPEHEVALVTRLPVQGCDWLTLGRLGAELPARWRRLSAMLAQGPAPVPAADGEAERALSLLTRMDQPSLGEDSLQDVAQILVDGLQLDYLSVWSLRPEAAAQPVLGLRIWRGEAVGWPAPEQRLLLRRVLGGQPVLHPREARRLLPDDPLPDLLGLEAVAGWPIRDDLGVVLGALIIGARRALPARVVPVLLQAVATRFGHRLQLQQAREEAMAKGLLDLLTGLPNRLLFHDRLDTSLREARRTGESFAVLLLDVDHFQRINDSHGHEVGDLVLRETARRLQAAVRNSDTVARYRGDEFTLVLRHIIRREDVLRVAEKVVQAMHQPLPLAEEVSLALSASIGVSFFPTDAIDAESLMRHAQEAARGAKSLGRNNVQLYAPGLEQAQRQTQALKAQLRHAERNGELRLYYQPQVDAASEDIIGMEALLRWEHPQLGAVSPAFFVPLAEESGQIISIGEWALREACQQARAWETRYGLRLRLGINLSAVQLRQSSVLGMITQVLAETGLDPDLLELEVTESLSVKAIPGLIDTLQGLRNLGCHVAIDDFGTGAASLDYLRRLPADCIKIDQSFVRNIGIDPDDEAIVRATIEMAHQLGRSVVAEGVEIEQHLQFLRGAGCDELQGYLFCRPLPASGFDNLLKERQRLLETTVDIGLA